MIPVPATAGAPRGRRYARRPRGGQGTPLVRAQRMLFWPFVAPALLLFIVFFVVPIAADVVLSLYSWAGIGEMEFRGLDNYRRIFNDAYFRTSMLNTLAIFFIGGTATFLLAFLATLGLREIRAGRRFARSTMFFPNLVNALVFGSLVGLLLAPNGPLNSMLRALGVENPPPWLARENLFTLVMLVIVWTSTGYFVTIILSAVDQIPPSYYEAAELDGAGPLRRLTNVTIPLAWDVISVCAILWTISSIKTFELVLVFGNAAGLPPAEIWTGALYVYAYSQGATGLGARDFGIATAAALVCLVLVAVLVILIRRVLRRETITL